MQVQKIFYSNKNKLEIAKKIVLKKHKLMQKIFYEKQLFLKIP